MTWRPRARHSDTSHRKSGLSSGAPPVMSTVGIVVFSSACETQRHRLAGHHLAAIGPRVDMTVPARLVAELADVDLEDLDLLSDLQRPLARPLERFIELASERQTAQHLVLNVGEASGSAAGEKRGRHSHSQLQGMPAHLQTMDERCAAANRGRDVNGFRHLVQIGALFERVPAVRVDAVRTLHRVRDGQRDDRLLASRQARRRRTPRRTNRRTSPRDRGRSCRFPGTGRDPHRCNSGWPFHLLQC